MYLPFILHGIQQHGVFLGFSWWVGPFGHSGSVFHFSCIYFSSLFLDTGSLGLLVYIFLSISIYQSMYVTVYLSKYQSFLQISNHIRARTCMHTSYNTGSSSKERERDRIDRARGMLHEAVENLTTLRS